MNEDFHQWLMKWIIFILTALIGASAAGIAALLRNGDPITGWQIFRAAFVSMVVGAIFLTALWDSLAVSRPGWLLAVVLCSGAGGGSMLDIVARTLKGSVQRWGKDQK